MVQRIPEQRGVTMSPGNPADFSDEDGDHVHEDELIAGDDNARPEPAQRFSAPRISQRLPRLSLSPGTASEGEILVGRYRVERVVSRTPHEVVLEASHLDLGQRVLLRHQTALASASPEAVARFQRGARKAREMRSEHAERVVDFGRLDSGSPYRAVELPRGPSLAEILRVRGALPISEAVDIVLTACEPVAEAHASGVVHRCLSTANIFVERRSDGSPLVRVLDFGVSDPLEPDWVNGDELAAPGAGASVDLLRYASPEQIRNPNAVDARADVWALGAILYELIAGAPLFQAEGPLTLLAMIAADMPTPLGLLRTDVPADLEQLVLSCLEKDPNARPRSVVEVVLALAPYASPDAQPAAARVARIVMRTTRPPPMPSQGPMSAGVPSNRALVRSYPPPRLEAASTVRAEARGFGMLFAGAAIGLAAAILAPRLAQPPAQSPAPVALVAPAAQPPVVQTALPNPAPVAAAPATVVATTAAPLAPAAVVRPASAVAAPPLAPASRSLAAPVAARPTRAVATVAEADAPRGAARTAPELGKAKAETKTASADDLFGGTD